MICFDLHVCGLVPASSCAELLLGGVALPPCVVAGGSGQHRLAGERSVCHQRAQGVHCVHVGLSLDVHTHGGARQRAGCICQLYSISGLVHGAGCALYECGAGAARPQPAVFNRFAGLELERARKKNSTSGSSRRRFSWRGRGRRTAAEEAAGGDSAGEGKEEAQHQWKQQEEIQLERRERRTAAEEAAGGELERVRKKNSTSGSSRSRFSWRGRERRTAPVEAAGGDSAGEGEEEEQQQLLHCSRALDEKN